MNRTLSSEAIAAVGAAQNEPLHLLQADLDSGTFYFTDCFRDVVWNGNTFQATGDLISFDDIEETSESKISQTTFHLSGVAQTVIAAFEQDEYMDRRIRLWKTFVRTDGSVMDPELIFDGKMDGPVIQENPKPNEGTCTIDIPATSHFGDFERKPGRRTNSNIQQLFFPGDLFFDFTSQIPAQKQSAWGRT